jgi:large subunit ribosomal protein L31
MFLRPSFAPTSPKATNGHGKASDGQRMKKEIHPADHRDVIFEDVTSGKRFLIASTVRADKTDKWEDGKEYPVFHVEISSASHPFYTGVSKTIDTAGRVDKFKKRAAVSKSKASKK